MQLIFPQQITAHSASSIGKAANGPQLPAWLNESLCWRKRYCHGTLSPCAVICYLMSCSEGSCPSIPRWSWTSPPNLPALEGGCVFRGLSALSLLILAITSAPATTGEKTLMKAHSWPRRWGRCLL